MRVKRRFTVSLLIAEVSELMGVTRDQLIGIAIRNGVVRWCKSGRYEILSYQSLTNTIWAERLIEPTETHEIFSRPNQFHNCIEIRRDDLIKVGDLYR